MKIDLDDVKIEDLELSEKSKELLSYTVSKFKRSKAVDSLNISKIRFEIETNPTEMISLTRFELSVGYGVDSLNIRDFKKPIISMNGFFELTVTLLVEARNDDGSIGCAHLEKHLLLPKL